MTKPALLEAARRSFSKLHEIVSTLRPEDRELPGICEDWSTKDLLAHLDAWHGMFLIWEEAGRRGKLPAMPRTGYSWREVPALNAAIHRETAADPWPTVAKRLHRSQQSFIDVIDGYSDEDLFTKRRFAWTGSTSVGGYATSVTSSHHSWAADLMAKWLRSKPISAVPESNVESL